jgi:hypothetical protein
MFVSIGLTVGLFLHGEDSTNNILILLAATMTSTVFFFGKIRTKYRRLIQAYINDRNGHKVLLDKAEIAWGEFRLNGTCSNHGSHLKEIFNSLTNEDPAPLLNWESLSEALDLKNSYDISTLKDGICSFNTTLKKNATQYSKVLIKLVKLEGNNRVLVLIEKDNAKNVGELKIASTNEHLTSITNLVEESLEELSVYLQANKMRFNIKSDCEQGIACDPLQVKGYIIQLIQDVSQFIVNAGDNRKVDIVIYNDFAGVKIDLILYQGPLSDKNTETLEGPLNRFERDMAKYNARINLENNFDKNKNFLFANLSVVVS